MMVIWCVQDLLKWLPEFGDFMVFNNRIYDDVLKVFRRLQALTWKQ